jgi:prepilin-type N-terminal cleavage/methylation domain-containing protein
MKRLAIGDFRLAIGSWRLLNSVAARGFFRCDGNCGQFGGFLEKCCKFGLRKQLSFLNHLKPKTALVRFFLNDAHLCNKFSFAPGTAGRTVVCADTGSCAPKLFAQDFCNQSPGQTLDNIQAAVAKLLGSPLQFFLSHRKTLQSPTPACRAKITAVNRQSPIENRKFPPAFTLIEVLVSVAVLAIILVMVLQVVNGLLQSTRTQTQKIDSSAAARRVLDVMSTDLQSAVVGENSAILAPIVSTNTLLAFLTTRRGPAGTPNPRFLAVRYALTNNEVFRSYGAVNSSQTNLIDANLATVTPNEPLAKGILAIQIRAVTETNRYPVGAEPSANWATRVQYNGIPIPSGYQALLTRSSLFASAAPNTLALEIWIAAVDEQNAEVLKSINRSYNPTNSNPAAWRNEIDKSTNLTSQAKASIRVLNKIIPLP